MKKFTLFVATVLTAFPLLSALASDGSEALRRWKEAFDNEQHRLRQVSRQDETFTCVHSSIQHTEKPSGP
ncbi:hypothetical protein ALQ17_01961 [Pseudomonas fluorescens]|nr:hypothetical protein ALQ17_01961 [Pseudomonas fluorescens]